MTTPAVNINETILANAQVCTGSNGTVNPGSCYNYGAIPVKWRRKVRPASGNSPIVKGWRPCKVWSHVGHDWERSRERVRREVTFNNWATSSLTEYRDGSYWSVNPPSIPAFPSGLINRAEQKALLKLRDHDFDLGVFLAEIQQTMNLVGSSALRIARAVRWFRRTKRDTTWQQVKKWEVGNCLKENWGFIPGSWLELQYGWLPLMSDIWAAMGYAQSLARDLGAVAHVTSSQQTHDLFSSAAAPLIGASTCTMKYRTKHVCNISLYFEVQDIVLAELGSLGLVNPASIVWERLMYSFVVDWFLPVGDWLQSISAPAGFAFKGGSRSTISRMEFVEATDKRFETFNSGSTHYRCSGEFPSMKGNAFAFNRHCYTSTPVPGLYLKNPVSPVHMLNGIALLLQAFRPARR